MNYRIRYTPAALKDMDDLWDDVLKASASYETADKYVGTSKNSFLPKFLTWLELFFENHTELSW